MPLHWRVRFIAHARSVKCDAYSSTWVPRVCRVWRPRRCVVMVNGRRHHHRGQVQQRLCRIFASPRQHVKKPPWSFSKTSWTKTFTRGPSAKCFARKMKVKIKHRNDVQQTRRLTRRFVPVVNEIAILAHTLCSEGKRAESV